MKAVKDNKVYTVDETTKASYLAAGFDIIGDDGKVIERSPSSTVSRKEYDELLAKYDALAAEKTATLTVEDTVAAEDAEDAEEPEKQPKKKGKSGGEPDVSGTE